MERREPNRTVYLTAIAMALVTLPVLYVGAYFMTVSRFQAARSTDAYWAQYPIGGDAAQSFFAPIHLLDRTIREDYWQPPKPVSADLQAFGEPVP